MPARLQKIREAEFIMKRCIFLSTLSVPAMAICVAGICIAVSLNLQANELQIGRYSLYAATPTEAQVDLLATTITTRFSERIQTVGEAARYLLQRSGYRLATAKSIEPDTAQLFALPFPAVHQSLGPMTLRDALETVAGPAFNLVQDPVHRLITFERCAAFMQVVEQQSGWAATRIDQVNGQVDFPGPAGQAHSTSLPR